MTRIPNAEDELRSLIQLHHDCKTAGLLDQNGRLRSPSISARNLKCFLLLSDNSEYADLYPGDQVFIGRKGDA